MILSFGTFEFEVDNLSDRNASVSTYFLAAFAMLYVVGAALPKVDFLTKIDQVSTHGKHECTHARSWIWCASLLQIFDGPHPTLIS